MRDTKDALVSAAADLIDEGGPAMVTLREVGMRAGVSHNAPYRHFADKRDLLAAVATAELRALAEAMARVSAETPPGAAAVEAVAGIYLDWALRHPERFKLTFGRWDDGHPDLADAATAATDVVRHCVTAAHAQGDLSGDPAMTTMLVHAAGHGAVDLALGGHLGKPAPVEPRLLVRALLDRLRS
jgi:AcrR family transcriptional regulator